MGFLDSLFGGKSDQPGYHQAQQSPETKWLIETQQARADQSPQEMLEKQYSGAPKLADTQSQVAGAAQFNKALGMASPDQLNTVLTNRAQKSMESDLAKAKRLGIIGAWKDKAAKQQQVGQSAVRANQINLEIQEAQKKSLDDKKRARNATLGTILGIGGAVAGGLVGGLPGAAVGSSLGSSVGGGD